MIYIIAEKPSLARAIAQELPGQKTKGDNCIIAGEYKVGWLAGHVLEMLKPEEYNEQYKSWKLDDLPIIPGQWKLKPIQKASALLASVKKHLKDAREVINAGDPDREGQLLVDEVLHYLNWKGSTKRLLVNDPSPTGVKQAISKITENSRFESLYDSGLARQRGDWIFGLNMTRLYTILGQQGGYDGVLSVGRVQAPVLGLIVQRQKEIDNFKPKNFYEIFSKIKGVDFKCSIPENLNEYLDEENRLKNKSVAEKIKNKLTGIGKVKTIKKEEKSDNPPLPYSLAEIQIAANNGYGYSAQQVLDVCQSLYEKHKLITYPRSDCRYLPEKHFEDREAIINTIFSNIGEYKLWGIDTGLKSKAFNDKKITAHHALVPTTSQAELAKLSPPEQTIYRMVSERYLLQFLPSHKYLITLVTVIKDVFTLTASGKQISQMGWREDSQEKKAKDVMIPEFHEGEEIEAAGAYLMEKTTTPPLLFTEATLLKAMKNIAKYVINTELKKILKETDGIGTPATQSQIIETLFKRNYIKKQKKSIVPTDIGTDMANILPEVATTPDMTAYWEKYLSEIEKGNIPLENFMVKIKRQVTKLTEEGKKLEKLELRSTGNGLVCPKCKKGNVKKGKFSYRCSYHQICDFSVSKDIAGKKINEKQLEMLISKGKTSVINGFKSKEDKNFSASLILDENARVKFDFGKTKTKRNYKKRK